MTPPSFKTPSMSSHHDPISKEAENILRKNDLGGYTVPATGLYPYQWNWDSGFIALGWHTFDPERAWVEIDTLLKAQWKDGMVPHIVFHQYTPRYFPGPNIWQAQGASGIATTGITQPPILATVVRMMYEHSSDRTQALEHVRRVWPKLLAYHRWFIRYRDPTHQGWVVSVHPWETGMDNSPMWDEAMAKVPIDDLPPYQRQDTTHVDSAQRPTKEDYDRFLTLLYRYRQVHYEPQKVVEQAPFKVIDICTNSIFLRAQEDLLKLAEYLEEKSVYSELKAYIELSKHAFFAKYRSEHPLFQSQNAITQKFLDADTSAGFLPLYAHAVTPEQAARMVPVLEDWLKKVEYGVPSIDAHDPRFDAQRYWRGPVWINVNWMISAGLRDYGYHQLAARLDNYSFKLIEQNGFVEYYDPLKGAGAGSPNFSWTAALYLWMKSER
jgi:glycogen debranching enzyme